MRYESAYSMLADIEPMFLAGLTEEQRSELYGVDDYESYSYQTDGATVVVSDSLNGDVLSTDTMEDFLRNTLEYLEEKCAGPVAYHVPASR